jgi:DNA-binding response OmpR family regulator
MVSLTEETTSEAVTMPSILLVDDEPGLLKLFAGLMDRLNCRVIQACGGSAALDILEQETPDLLILDLAMPGISGVDVLRWVRENQRLDTMKVIILTARPNMIVEVETMGIDYWISKPVVPMDFLELVDDILSGAL